MTKDLDFTQGSISKKILLFSLPLMAGNIFQQLYNVVDTLIVGRFLGEAPLAAVGSAYTLMIFITSILIGLTMGSGVYFSICHGQKNTARMKQSIYISFLSIGALSLFLNAISYIFLEEIIRFMQIPADVASYFRDYLLWIFSGIIAVFLYNYGSLMGNFTQVLWQSTFVIYIPSKKFEEAVYKINTDLSLVIGCSLELQIIITVSLNKLGNLFG